MRVVVCDVDDSDDKNGSMEMTGSAAKAHLANQSRESSFNSMSFDVIGC